MIPSDRVYRRAAKKIRQIHTGWTGFRDGASKDAPLQNLFWPFYSA